MIRVIEGPINPAFGWHDGLDARVLGGPQRWPETRSVTVTRYGGDPHAVVSVGSTIIHAIRVGVTVCAGDVVELTS